MELHNGDAFPESEGPPAMQRLHETRLLSAASIIELNGFREERKALISNVQIPKTMKGSLIVTATLSANKRTYDAKKFESYLDDEKLTIVSKYRRDHGEQGNAVQEIYSKYAKALIISGDPSDFTTRPVGLKFEIVPSVDPGMLKAGASMPIQVLFEGKPAAGVTIETTWSTGQSAKASVVGQTGRDGRLSVPLQHGKCRITTGWSQRFPDQTVANWETFFATLTFEME